MQRYQEFKLEQAIYNLGDIDQTKFYQTKNWNDFIQYIEEFLTIVEDNLKSQYQITELPEVPIYEPLYKVFKTKHSIPQLKSARILDLACGSSSGGDDWKPWFCRALHEIGSSVVGVDYASLQYEKFECYQADLTNPQVALAQLEAKQFDIVICSNFIISPALYQLSDDKIEEIALGIITQAKRVLKDDGYLCLDYFADEYVIPCTRL